MKLTPTMQVAAACALWSFAALTRKLVLVSISPFFLNYLNCIFAVVLVAIFSKTNFKKLLSIFKQNKLLFFLNSFFGATIGLSLAYYSLERIDLSLYGLLVKLQPIFVIILANVFLKEKISAKKLPFIFLAIISSLIISYDNELKLENAKLLGIIAAILTALSLSISTITGKAIIKNNATPDQTTIIRFLLGGILLTPALIIEPLFKVQSLDFKTNLLLFSGIVANALACILYYKGLKYLDAVKATILELLMPIFTVILAYVFLKEALSNLQIAASILLVLSIIKLELYDITKASKTVN